LKSTETAAISAASSDWFIISAISAR